MLVNIKLKLVVGMLINKLSLIWPISLYNNNNCVVVVVLHKYPAASVHQ